MLLCAALISLKVAFAEGLREIRPTPEGVFSIHASDALHCSNECGGDWSGPGCWNLRGAVVSLYVRGDTSSEPRSARPLVSVVVDAEGFADIPSLLPGTYQWEMSLPGRVTERGEVAVGQPLPAPTTCSPAPGQDCLTRVVRPLEAGERPRGTWFDVQLWPNGVRPSPQVDVGLAAQKTTLSADDLARLPMR